MTWYAFLPIISHSASDNTDMRTNTGPTGEQTRMLKCGDLNKIRSGSGLFSVFFFSPGRRVCPPGRALTVSMAPWQEVWITTGKEESFLSQTDRSTYWSQAGKVVNQRGLTWICCLCSHALFVYHISSSVPSYESCDGPGVCGYDLHDGEGVAWGQEGKYSTTLFTQRARKILESHDPGDRPLFLLLSLQV